MAQTQREADSGLELALMGQTYGRLTSHLGLLYRELGFQFILYWENYVNVINSEFYQLTRQPLSQREADNTDNV